MPEYLYHYTRSEGLIGIVNTGKIWATNILYLNDAKEFRHGVELGAKYVKQLFEEATDPDQKAYLEQLEASVDKMKTANAAPGYVCSFSELEDDLSQWRAYCPTGGFAIGFRRNLLQAIAYERLYMFDKCSYDLEQQKRAISAYIDHGMATDKDVPKWPMKCTWATMRLATASATLKASAFCSEKEWRMVRYPGPDSEKENMEFRTKNGIVVPYMNCDLTFKVNTDQTEEMWKSVRVTVGPTPDPEASKASVEKLLRLRSPAEDAGTVTITSVPYKFW